MVAENSADLAFLKAIGDPAQVFSDPSEILSASGFSDEQKFSLLKTWRADAEALERAKGESMAGGEKSRLRSVQLAIEKFEASQKSNRSDQV